MVIHFNYVQAKHRNDDLKPCVKQSFKRATIGKLSQGFGTSPGRLVLLLVACTYLLLHHAKLRIHALEVEPEAARAIENLLEVSQGDFTELLRNRR